MTLPLWEEAEQFRWQGENLPRSLFVNYHIAFFLSKFTFRHGTVPLFLFSTRTPYVVLGSKIG